MVGGFFSDCINERIKTAGVTGKFCIFAKSLIQEFNIMRTIGIFIIAVIAVAAVVTAIAVPIIVNSKHRNKYK